MLDKFNTPVSKVVLPDYDNYVGAYGRMVDTAITKGVLYFVKNQHPLVRIVRRIYDTDSDWLLSYRRNLASVHAFLRKELYTGFDSEGRSKENPFFSDGMEWYMIYNLSMPKIDLLDPSIIDPYQYRPLRFISHNRTGLAMFPLDGTELVAGDDGITYTELHVGELILAWRAYVRLSAISDMKPDPASFVARFVLTPAFKSYANVALFNRLHSISMGKEIETDAIDRRWGVFDYNKPMMDAAMKKALDSNKKFRIRDILSLSPSIHDTVDFFIVESDRNIINTSFINMSRLDTLIKVMEMIPERYRRKFNRSDRATIIQRFDKGLKEELNRPFAGNLYTVFLSKIDYLITLFGR